MLKPSINEIIFIGLPVLLFTGLTANKGMETQLLAAFWGGWLGALLWFVILRGEYINPFKFTVMFVIMPGFLLSSSYYVYRKPIELKQITPRMREYAAADIDRADPVYLRLLEDKKKKMHSLYRDCGWIWLVGSVLAALIFAQFYLDSSSRLRYAYRDTLRSRAMLGRAPSGPAPSALPPKTGLEREQRMSVENIEQAKPRIP